jgi:hypothetical protein
VAGLKVSEIVRRPGFPRNCVFIAVESQTGEVAVTEGSTVIDAGANVILAAHRPDLPEVLQFVTSTRPGGQGEQEPDAVEALALVGLFSGISRGDLADLAVGARFAKSRAGEAVYRVGDPGDRLYVLRAGTVELVTPGGAKTSVRAGGHFGVTSALVGEPRNHSARVVEDAELLALDGTALRAVMLRNPFLAVELAKGLGERPAGGPTT